MSVVLSPSSPSMQVKDFLILNYYHFIHLDAITVSDKMAHLIFDGRLV